MHADATRARRTQRQLPLICVHLRPSAVPNPLPSPLDMGCFARFCVSPAPPPAASASKPRSEPPPMPAEPHFTPRLFKFLRELKRNNERPWFQANKARYIADVQEPMLRFIA